jgi:hypothetical protein
MALKSGTPHTPISGKLEAQSTPFCVTLRNENGNHYRLEVVRDHQKRPDSTVRLGWRVRVIRWPLSGGEVVTVLDRPRPSLTAAMRETEGILSNYIRYVPEAGESIWRGGLL